MFQICAQPSHGSPRRPRLPCIAKSQHPTYICTDTGNAASDPVLTPTITTSHRKMLRLNIRTKQKHKKAQRQTQKRTHVMTQMMKTTPRGGHDQDSSRSFEHDIESIHNRDEEGTKETEYNAENDVHEQVRSTKRLAATIVTHQREYCGYEIRIENLRRSPTVARC